jgi:glycosyltransferase involved in cell wall biosynthesis
MYRVTVTVPSLNPGVPLRDCVSSIREDSAGIKLEMIVVDDGSSNETSIRVLRG